MSDKQIIEALRHGSQEERDQALTFFYLKTGLRAKASAAVRKLGGTQDEAADAFQEAIFFLQRRLMAGGLKKDDKLKSFFISIVCYEWLAKKRKESNHAKKLNSWVQDDHEPLPDQMFIDTERTNALHEAIALLDNKCQQVLNLKMQEYSSAEIARLLSFSNANVAKTKASKCRERLSEIIRKSPYFMETLNINSYGKK